MQLFLTIKNYTTVDPKHRWESALRPGSNTWNSSGGNRDNVCNKCRPLHVYCFSVSLALSHYWVSRNKRKQEWTQAGRQGRQGFGKVDTPSNKRKQEEKQTEKGDKASKRRTHHPTKRDKKIRKEDEPGNKLDDKMGNKLGDKLEDKLGDKLRDKLGEKLGDKLGDKLGEKLGEKLETS